MTIETVKFDYLNYKGELQSRTVTPHAIEWISKPGFGYEPGWFLTGWDRDKDAIRSFRLSNIVVSDKDRGLTLFLMEE